MTSCDIFARSPSGRSGVSTGNSRRSIRVGPLPVSNMARVVISNPAVRNNQTASSKQEERMKAQGVPFGGLSSEAPTTRLGRFLPALRDDLHPRSTPLVFRAGGTNPPATRFPRGGHPPRPAQPLPSLGRVNRLKTTTGDHNVPSPPRPFFPFGPARPSCGALRTAPESFWSTEPLSPSQGGDSFSINAPACYMRDNDSSGVAQDVPHLPGKDQVALSPP